MATQPFPFITDGIHGSVPINFFPAADSDKQAILLPSPGLLELCTLTDCTEVRGMYSVGAYLYVVAQRGSESVLWRVDTSGGFAEIGTITTSSSGPVWIFHNTNQMCIVDGVSAYVYTFSTAAFVQITDLAFPGASSGAYQDGYGLFTEPSSNRWFFSAIQDFTTFNALDFYSKESKPDEVLGLTSYMKEVWLFGKTSGTEVWYNAGGDNSSLNASTFVRNPGGVIPYACGAAGTILPENVNSPRTKLRWLSSEGQVVEAAGYTVNPISNQMLEKEIQKMATFSDAISFEYKDQGHVFTQYTFPTADQTWLWDATTKLWHRKQSYLNDGSGYGRHRANCYTLLGNKHYVGDYSNGKVYEMNTDYYDDAGEDIRREVYYQEIMSGLERTYFPPVQIIVEPGVGLIDGTDPQIMLQFSSTFGNTWTDEVWQSAGLIGDYGKRAMWQQQGSGFQRMYKAVMTAPVLWRILGISWGSV